MRPVVLIFTRKVDGHADRLCSGLESEAVKPVRIHVEEIVQFRFEIGAHSQWIVLPNGEEVRCGDIRSVFVRALPASEDFGIVESQGAVSVSSYIAIQREALFQDWINTLSLQVPFFNNFGASLLCMGKSYQRAIANMIGLETPECYTGETPGKAQEFVSLQCNFGRRVCTKPIAHKTVLLNEIKSARYTEIFDGDPSELDALEGCPIIFQNYVPKAYELRAYVVGDEVLTCKISSQQGGERTSVDWRHYNIPQTPHEKYKLPQDLSKKLLLFHRKVGLRFSAFDFIRTPEGRYVFLETNPTGQWLWLEDLVGLPISVVLARQLASPGAI